MKQSAIYTKAVKSEESALKGGSGAESTTTVTEQNKQSMSFTTGNSTLTSSGIVATASDTRLGKLSLSQYFESDTAARDGSQQIALELLRKNWRKNIHV